MKLCNYQSLNYWDMTNNFKEKGEAMKDIKIESIITLERINEIIKEFDSVEPSKLDNMSRLMYSVIKTQQIVIKEKQDDFISIGVR